MLDFFFEMRRADAAYTCVGLLRVRVRVLGFDPSPKLTRCVGRTPKTIRAALEAYVAS